MSSAKPTRKQADLADVLELILHKGIVINADIAITVGETEMIGIELRAAIASFETAAEYGLAFPSGTDMRRVEQASGREPLDEDGVDLGIGASSGGEIPGRTHDPPGRRPDPSIPFVEGGIETDEKDGEAENAGGTEGPEDDAEGTEENGDREGTEESEDDTEGTGEAEDTGRTEENENGEGTGATGETGEANGGGQENR